MIVVGLTGSIAMGKSEVARICRARGLPVFDSDAAVHALYDSAEGATLIREYTPAGVVNGKVDRAILTRLVLADKTLLDRLETAVHQVIARKRDDFISGHRQQGTAIVILDIPLLFEKKLEALVDVTMVVSARPEVQKSRALLRPGMTEEKLVMILSRQMPDAEKRRHADIVIENNGTLAELEQRVDAALVQVQKWKQP